MPDDNRDTNGDRGQPGGDGTGDSVTRTRIDPDVETAEYELLALVARVRGVDIDDLPLLYTQIDNIVKQLFSTPPAVGAEMVVSFSYADCRVTLTQDGSVTIDPQAD
jgi:hypothetical protein